MVRDELQGYRGHKELRDAAREELAVSIQDNAGGKLTRDRERASSRSMCVRPPPRLVTRMSFDRCLQLLREQSASLAGLHSPPCSKRLTSKIGQKQFRRSTTMTRQMTAAKWWNDTYDSRFARATGEESGYQRHGYLACLRLLEQRRIGVTVPVACPPRDRLQNEPRRVLGCHRRWDTSHCINHLEVPDQLLQEWKANVDIEQGCEIGGILGTLLQGVGPNPCGCNKDEEPGHDVVDLCMQLVPRRWARQSRVRAPGRVCVPRASFPSVRRVQPDRAQQRGTHVRRRCQ